MSIKPTNNSPKSSDFEYEQVKTDEFISGVISQVEFDPEYKQTFNGETKVIEAVRFTFDLDGYEYPKKTFWIKLSYHSKSKLYKLYLKNLVEDSKEFMDFDLSLLEGMKIKAIFEMNDKGFSNISMVKPEGEKISTWE